MTDQELLYMCLGALKVSCDNDHEELKELITVLEDRLYTENETGIAPVGEK